MAPPFRLPPLLCLFFVALLNAGPVSGAVVGIDLGAAFTKTGLAAVGKPLEIVLDIHSKRKTPAAVSFVKETREFGGAALAEAHKSPRDVFQYTKGLLGRAVDSSEIESLLEGVLPSHMKKNERRQTPEFRLTRSPNVTLSAEEITANLIQNIAKTVARHLNLKSNEAPLDAVFGVPVNFAQRHRRALLDACKVANVRPVGFVRDVAAAALHHARDLPTNFTGTKLFVDVGAMQTSACLAKYRVGLKKIDTQVLACQTCQGVGGLHFDKLLIRHLANNAREKLGLREIPQSAMQRLIAQARKAKLHLSVNKKAEIGIEDFVEGRDFRTSITRSAFEDLISPLLGELPSLVNRVVAEGNTTLTDLAGAEVIGGAWRVPLVLSALERAVKPLDLSQRVNGDEGVAMGATLVAANATIKVTSLRLIDTSSFTYDLHLQNSTSTIAHKTLLARNSWWATTYKTLTTRGCSDLQVKLTETDPTTSSNAGVGVLTTYQVTGVEDACRGPHKEHGLPRVSLVFAMSPLGIIEIERAVAVWEETYMAPDPKWKPPKSTSTPAPTPTPTHAPGDDNVDKSKAASTADGTPGTTTTITTASSTTATATSGAPVSTTPSAAELQAPIIQQTRRHSVKLQIQVDREPPLPMDADEMAAATTTLRHFSEVDYAAERRARARNTLEARVYALRESLDQQAVVAVTTEKFRSEMGVALEDEEEWIYENENKATAEEILERLRALDARMADALSRAAEFQERTELKKAVGRLQSAITTELESPPSETVHYNETEVAAFMSRWRAFQATFEKNMTAQGESDPTAQPAFRAKDTRSELTSITRDFEALLVSARTTTTTPSTTVTGSNSTASGKEEAPTPTPAPIADAETPAHTRKEFSKPEPPPLDEL